MSNVPVRQSATKRRSARRPKNNTRSTPLARGRQPRTQRVNRMRVYHDSNQSISLAGTDMFQLQSEQTNGFGMTCNVLANPLYWYGTRLAGIAKVYQKYKPKRLRFRYVPNCPATSSGSVTIGVIEAGVTLSPDTAVTTLLNSGGKNINIYQSDAIDYYPKLKEPCYIDGDISKPVVNPFTFFMYTLKNADVPPGILYIDWEYEFYQGSGDQQIPIAVITTFTEDKKNALLALNDPIYTPAVLGLGWGAVLGFLKVVGVPILRKVGIVVCKTVLAWLSDDSKSNAVMSNTVTIREGSFLTIDPSDIYTGPDGKTRVKDSNGSDYYLPDTARVAIYMSGDAIQKPNAAAPTPPAPLHFQPGAYFQSFASATTVNCIEIAKRTEGSFDYYTCNWKGANKISDTLFANFNYEITLYLSNQGSSSRVCLQQLRWAYTASNTALGEPTSDFINQPLEVMYYSVDPAMPIAVYQEVAEPGTTNYYTIPIKSGVPSYQLDALENLRWLCKRVITDIAMTAWAPLAPYVGNLTDWNPPSLE